MLSSSKFSSDFCQAEQFLSDLGEVEIFFEIHLRDFVFVFVFLVEESSIRCLLFSKSLVNRLVFYQIIFSESNRRTKLQSLRFRPAPILFRFPHPMTIRTFPVLQRKLFNDACITSGPVSSVVRHLYLCGRYEVQFPSSSNCTQCYQRPATAAMFFGAVLHRRYVIPDIIV